MLDNDLQKLREQIDENKRLSEELRTEIDSLELKRVERLKEVTLNNADDTAQQALKTIENKLDESKSKRRDLQKQITEITQQYNQTQRQKSLRLSNNIQEELTRAREERDWLRSDFIPSLQRQLQELEERKKELDSLVLSLSKQLSVINRQNPSEDDGRNE